MARTIKEINDGLKTAFVTNVELMNKYGLEYSGDGAVEFFNSNFPTVSLEAILLFIVSVSSSAVETMFDWFKRDVNYMVEHERYGDTGWYEKMAKQFRYGEGIDNDYSNSGSFAESAIYSDEGLTEEDIESLQVVKHVYAMEGSGKGTVILKVSGETDGEISQLSQEQVTALANYINRVKPAGIPVNIVNAPAEILQLWLRIWIDPLVIDMQGNKILGDGIPVEDAINRYLKSIEFAGEFVAMRLIDEIQQADGVVVASFVSGISIAGNDSTEILERYSPYSGYFKLADMHNNTIEYLV